MTVPPVVAVVDAANFDYHRPVRIVRHSTGYQASGDVGYFAVLGGGNTSLFTADAAGKKARQIADFYVEYVFPKQGTDPLGLASLWVECAVLLTAGYAVALQTASRTALVAKTPLRVSPLER